MLRIEWNTTMLLINVMNAMYSPIYQSNMENMVFIIVEEDEVVGVM